MARPSVVEGRGGRVPGMREWRRRDPLTRARTRLVELGAQESVLEALETDVKKEIEDAVQFAETSPPADEYLQYVTKE